MRHLRRLTFLGSFAALGVGAAICVGLSQVPSADLPSPATGELAVRVVTEASPAPLGRDEPRQPGPAAAPLGPAAPPVPGPVVVEPYPPRAQQVVVPEIERERLEQAYDYLRRQLGADRVPAGAAAAAPTAPDTAAAPVAAPSGAGTLPAPPGPTPSVAPAPTPPAAPSAPTVQVRPANRSDRSVPRAVVDAEGDGKLSLRITNSDIREVLDLLGEQGNLNILAGSSVQGKVSATLNGVDIEGALEAILKSVGLTSRRQGKFIFVGTPDEFNSMEQAMDRVGTRVYRPNYVTAADLQKLIQPLLTERIGVVGVTTPAQMGIATDSNAAGGNTFSGGDVVVVRDYEAVLCQMDQMVAEVDVRPLQVHIEAMILSVKLKDTDQFGVNFDLLRDKPTIKFALGKPETALANVTYQAGTLKFGFLDSSLGTFLDALETLGDTNVIATPRLMVLNKQRAEIQIGEKKGYVSTTVTETSSTQSVEFLDIGALLRLRPFISTDGLIRMELHPELSDGDVVTTNGFTLPNKEVTQVTTNILIRDGCTVVIGGLMRENLANSTSQLPVLGNLPVVGFLFRTTKETIEKREVLVLITPHIVYEPGTCREGEKEAAEFHRRQGVFADKMSVFGKRSIGRRYFRLAQSAYAAGDRDTALRFAEMAVHFDPLSRAAIDLRSDIWLGKPSGEHTLQGPGGAPAGAPPTAEPVADEAFPPLDAPQLPDWLLGDLEHGPATPPAMPHPLDPGQPGRHQDLLRPRRLQ